MPSDIFDRLDPIAEVLPPQRWMLIGGMMVHAHARLAGVDHHRPTNDADLVVELRAGHYAEAAEALSSLGFLRHESFDVGAPFHRFVRGSAQVDLMAPEGAAVRFAGRPVLGVPGSRSALNRTIEFVTPSGTAIRIPGLASAVSLKGAAYQQPGANRTRHLQDAVTLFACAGRNQLQLSNSMRRNVNHLLKSLDATEAWATVSPMDRRRAVAAIVAVRPDWVVPDFVLAQRPRPARPTRRGSSRETWEHIEPPTRDPRRQPQSQGPSSSASSPTI